MNTKKNLEGKFNPKDFEETLYQRWEEKGYFKPTMDKNKKPYYDIYICRNTALQFKY